MVKRAPAKKRPRKAKPGSKGLGPRECRLEQVSGSAADAAEAAVVQSVVGNAVLLDVLPDGVGPPRGERVELHYTQFA